MRVENKRRFLCRLVSSCEFTLTKLGMSATRTHQGRLKRLSRSPRKHFTLVELLVVITIISVLAGMLLPALSKAMDSARSIVCLNNLKQCGTGIMMYAQGSNDIAPVPGDIDYSHAGRFWMDQLGAMGILEDSIGRTYPHPGWFYSRSSELTKGTPAVCPLTPPVSLFTSSGVSFTDSYCAQTTYGMRSTRKNWCSPGERQTGGGYHPLFRTLRTNVPFLADSVMTVNGELSQIANINLTVSVSGSIYFAHGDRANIWFPDGHAESWTAGDLAGIDDYYGVPATGVSEE